ncbi:uncharacterized protein LOC134477479 [Cavia porcellus]|uniref:uncharacterized protein LOC134477479 n=1 Tax=Cavia porcellus TaxID=10141 RepID=UPI002FE21875
MVQDLGSVQGPAPAYRSAATLQIGDDTHCDTQPWRVRGLRGGSSHARAGSAGRRCARHKDLSASAPGRGLGVSTADTPQQCERGSHGNAAAPARASNWQRGGRSSADHDAAPSPRVPRQSRVCIPARSAPLISCPHEPCPVSRPPTQSPRRRPPAWSRLHGTRGWSRRQALPPARASSLPPSRLPGLNSARPAQAPAPALAPAPAPVPPPRQSPPRARQAARASGAPCQVARPGRGREGSAAGAGPGRTTTFTQLARVPPRRRHQPPSWRGSARAAGHLVERRASPQSERASTERIELGGGELCRACAVLAYLGLCELSVLQNSGYSTRLTTISRDVVSYTQKAMDQH